MDNFDPTESKRRQLISSALRQTEALESSNRQLSEQLSELRKQKSELQKQKSRLLRLKWGQSDEKSAVASPTIE